MTTTMTKTTPAEARREAARAGSSMFFPESERSVLGAVLIDPLAYWDVAPLLKNEYFTDKNRQVWEAMCRLADRGIAIDYRTVTDELDAMGELAEIGGAAYITGLINATPTALNAIFYARIVRDAARARELMVAASDIASIADDQNTSTEEKIRKTQEIMLRVTVDETGDGARPLYRIIPEYTAQVEELARTGRDIIGVASGIKPIDDFFHGFRGGQLIILGGRPKMGKSALSLQIALSSAKAGHRPAVFSLEMSEMELASRLVSMETGIDNERLQLGKLKDDEWPLYIQSTAALSELPIFIDDTPGASVGQIVAQAKSLFMSEGIDLIIIDYMQLVQAVDGDGKQLNNRVQELSRIGKALKRLARELDIPVICLSQLSRALEQRQDKRPMMSDLRESGTIEEDADIIMFVYREGYYDPEAMYPDLTEVIVAGRRNGPTGTILLHFDRDKMRFYAVETHDINNLTGFSDAAEDPF